MPSTARSSAARSVPDKGAVLGKSVVKAATLLGVSQARLARVLGVSGATASRLFAGHYLLDPARGKEWELAALFVRLFRSLDSLVASDEKAKAWLNGMNHALGAKPVDLITTAEGLVRVIHYLDAARGRL